MSQKGKIGHSGVQWQSKCAELVEATCMAMRERWKNRLRTPQDGTVGTSGPSSDRLPDHATVVAEAKLRGAVTNDGAVSCALA